MPKIVIINTSPIFYLHRIGYLHVLEKWYGEIIVPYAVLTELEEGRRHGEDVPGIRIYDWIKIKNVKVPEFIKLIPDLGQGEAEVLALGCDERDSLIIIDDAIARKISRIQKLKFTGTAGVLLRGKKEGYVKEIKSVIKRLKEVGFYLSDELYTATLIAAKGVIPAKAGIQENTGFRVKPGMTKCIKLMSSCIIVEILRLSGEDS